MGPILAQTLVILPSLHSVALSVRCFLHEQEAREVQDGR